MSESPTEDFEIWSDGGVSSDNLAGAACIVKHHKQALRIKLLGVLDRCAPSEAELVGAIMGLSCTTLIQAEPFSVRWYCDNLPIIDGATTYLEKWQEQNWTRADATEVQAKTLWQMLALLKRNIDLKGHHSPGHSGISQNEACDKACRWASQDGEKLLGRFGEGPIGRQAELNPEHAWILIDLRNIFFTSVDALGPTEVLVQITNIIREAVKTRIT